MAKKKKKRVGKKSLLLLLILALFGVSGGGAWLVGRDGTVEDRREGQQQLFPDVEAAAVVALAIEKAGTPEVKIERDTASGRWQIIAPGAFQADQARVEELLVRMERAQVLAIQPVRGEAAVAAAKLDSPRVRVTLRSATGATHSLELGADAVGTGVYARRSGSVQVLTVASELADALTVGVLELRSRELFRVDPDRVAGVEVLAPAHTLDMARSDGDWQLLEPVAVAADRRRARELVVALTGARAREIVASDPGNAITGLEQPEVRVRLTSEGGVKTGWLDIGGAAGTSQRYARSGEELFIIDAALVTELLRDPIALQNRDLLDLPYDRAVAVAIRRNDGATTRLQSDAAGAWTLGVGAETDSPPTWAWPADATEVGLLLRALDLLEAASFNAVAVAEGDPAALHVEVSVRDGAELAFSVAPPAEDEALGRITTAAGKSYGVDQQLYDLLAAPELRYRSREVFAAPPAELLRSGEWSMKLTQQPPASAGVVAVARSYDLSRQEGAWRSLREGVAVDSTAVDALAMELLHLSARAYAGRWDGRSAPVQASGEGAPWCELSLELAGAPARVWQLTVYGAAMGHPGMFVATSSGCDLVFLLGESTARRFVAELE